MLVRGDEAGKKATFTAKEIRRALQKLEPMLGIAAVETTIQDLEIYGLPLVNDHIPYTFKEIEVAMSKMLGTDATTLLIERLKKILICI